jgi:hypothetical protein
MAERGGNLELALQHAQAAKSQQPEDAAINDTLGWVYYKRDLPLLAIPLAGAERGERPEERGGCSLNCTSG